MNHDRNERSPARAGLTEVRKHGRALRHYTFKRLHARLARKAAVDPRSVRDALRRRLARGEVRVAGLVPDPSPSPFGGRRFVTEYVETRGRPQ